MENQNQIILEPIFKKKVCETASKLIYFNNEISGKK